MSLFSFRRHERIRKSREFITIYTKGVKKESRYFKAAILPNNLEWCRLGITVSKKIGKAVQRNSIKRRLREYFRLHKPYLPLPSACDIVLTAKIGAQTLSYHQIKTELDQLLCSGTVRPEKLTR